MTEGVSEPVREQPRVSGIEVRKHPTSYPPKSGVDGATGLQQSLDGEMRVGYIPVSDLSCVYQPIVDLSTGDHFAYEVLARCRFPGLTSPEELFARASAEGFCGPLGRVLRNISATQVRGVPVFLNVHPSEVGAGFVAALDDPMYSHDADVFVEITESVPFSHDHHCFSILREMREQGGVQLVVDDLGAGYSNLKRLADLEPAIVKLDRRLVSGIDKNPRQRLLVQAVVSMCVDLGARVVAEGLETSDEVRAVQDSGCHLGQGFVLGRPSAIPTPPTWKP